MPPTPEGSIKLVSAMLDVEEPEGDEPVLIVRGVIDPYSLERLRVDDYQREQLSPAKIAKIKKGIRSRGVPDIVLGMRGESLQERPTGMFLYDPVYIIDGLQRRTAALELMGEVDGILPRLGVKVHLNTDYKFEKDLFDKLNAEQNKVSSNILLRNRRDELPALNALYVLTTDRGFIMQNKIAWGQHMSRGDLISSVTYVKVAAMLHSHAGPGRAGAALEVAQGLEKIMEAITRKVMVENTRRYFEVIDQCWGVGRVHYRRMATYLKAGFLMQLARVFSDHPVFWKEDYLSLDASDIRKLSQFPINDPQVQTLAASGGMSGELLYQLMVDHINSGRRKRRLVPRRSLRDRPFELVEDIEEEDAA